MSRSLLISFTLAALVAAPLAAQDAPGKKASGKQDAPKKEAAQTQRIADLIEGLGAAEYKVRQDAYDALVAIGPPAQAALQKAQQSEDPEVAAAAAEALVAIRAKHKLPKAKTKTPQKGPQKTQPRGLDERDLPGLRPIPGQEEMLKQLEGQFPEMRKLLEQMRKGQGGGGFRLLDPNDPMLKDLFQGRNPFQELFGEQEQGQQADPNKRPGTRMRTFSWSNVPGRSGPGADLGLRLRNASPVLASQLDLPRGQGLVVHQLLPQSFAKTQGVQQYDILLDAAGKPLNTEADLVELVAKGGKVTLLRHGKRQVLTFTKAPKRAAAPRRLRARPARPRQPEPKPKDDETRDF